MPNHNQPTKEELKAKQEEAAALTEEELNNVPEDEDEEETPEEKKSKPNKKEDPHEEKDDEGEDPEGDEEAEEEEEKEEEAEPSKELYKKKFSASSRENQRINAKNRVINNALIEADDIPEPTEEELGTEYKDWDIATDLEKISLKEALISKRWRAKISQAKDQATKIEKWNDSVEVFVDDPKTLLDNPELEGKTDEFKAFATDEANNSVPFKILISAFLHDHQANRVSNKGKMFERGSGGPNDKPQSKNDTITLDEARKLRQSDYPKWKEYLKAGKIKSDL